MAQASINKLAADYLYTEGSAAALKALAELAYLAKVTENWEAICTRAAENLRPVVRTVLKECWARTGLNRHGQRKKWPNGDYSGALYDAWVTQSIIKANQKGIIVYLAQGMADSVYARAGSFQFGAVYGAGKRHSSKSAERFKQKLKSGVTENRKIGGGVRVLAPKPIGFDGDQIDLLASYFVRLINEEIVRMK